MQLGEKKKSGKTFPDQSLHFYLEIQARATG